MKSKHIIYFPQKLVSKLKWAVNVKYIPDIKH